MMDEKQRRLGIERGFLPIEGTRVWVNGTRFHGSWGTVVDRPEGWPKRAIAVKLDEWDHVQKLFLHNILTELEIELKAYE